MTDNSATPSVTHPVVFDGKPVINFRDDQARRNFIKVAAIIGAGSTLAAATRHDRLARADVSATDLEILNYALTLEYLEAEFYTKGIEGDALSGRDLELVEPIREHEQEHVRTVRQTIKDVGGKAVEKPDVHLPGRHF